MHEIKVEKAYKINLITAVELKIITMILFYGLGSHLYSQSNTESYKSLGDLYVIPLSSAPFPHPERAEGHKYGGTTYPTQTHYNDSSVAVFIPGNFREGPNMDVVVYFHGWYNNIDSSLKTFRLLEQFTNSGKNAVFIFPQGPYNAPDSHSGKMEQKNGFRNLINNVLSFLADSVKLNYESLGNVILAGHSGAYRAISFCIEQGGLIDHVSEVILFDALYARTPVFLQWIQNYNGRFIDIYTDNGGTKNESLNLMSELDSLDITYIKTKEKKLKTPHLVSGKVIFIQSDLGHNDVISNRNQFQKFLSTSQLVSIEQIPIEKNLTNQAADDRYASYSPDGEKILFESNRDGNWELYIMNTNGTNQQRLTNNEYDDRRPSWHPQGHKILYESNKSGSFILYEYLLESGISVEIKTKNNYHEPIFARYAPDGNQIAFSDRLSEDQSQIVIIDTLGNEISRLADFGYRSFYPVWSSDGQKIVFFSRHQTNNQDDEIYSINRDGSQLKRLTLWPTHNFCPAFSNDNKKIAYVTSMENNRPEIYIMAADGKNKRRITFNNDGDTLPQWSANDTRLLVTGYRNGNYEIIEIQLP